MQNDFLKFAVSQGLNSMHVEKIMSESAKHRRRHHHPRSHKKSAGQQSDRHSK